jgi:hypothetical protein
MRPYRIVCLVHGSDVLVILVYHAARPLGAADLPEDS